ncbi:hypothetical protein F5B19DRAFT_209962 [Rostrohypoxylon terebratum]|nr:hypothetical protein F5B19DRAFT_209962 [Rostrohypoxylon terebratum]
MLHVRCFIYYVGRGSTYMSLTHLFDFMFYVLLSIINMYIIACQVCWDNQHGISNILAISHKPHRCTPILLTPRPRKILLPSLNRSASKQAHHASPIHRALVSISKMFGQIGLIQATSYNNIKQPVSRSRVIRGGLCRQHRKPHARQSVTSSPTDRLVDLGTPAATIPSQGWGSWVVLKRTWLTARVTELGVQIHGLETPSYLSGRISAIRAS